MPKIPIKNIVARQILDSRGLPTVEVNVETAKGFGVFGVPSGVSTGKHEALELRDGGKEFEGLGISKAVANVNQILAKKIKGMDVQAQELIDRTMIDIDDTPNKSRLGANAILGVSGAVSKAAAVCLRRPLFKYLASLYKNKKPKLPLPMTVVIEGGAHGDTNLDLQEYLLIPHGKNLWENLKIVSEIFHELAKVLKSRKLNSNIGNEGAYSPHVESNKQPLDFILEAANNLNYKKGQDFSLALDVAASHFYNQKERQYILSADKTSLSAERLVSMLKEWAQHYSIISLEDPLAEEDWAGWRAMMERFGKNMLIVGDDLFVTQKSRLQKGINLKVANAVIIKPNQVGTVTETLETVQLAQKHNYKIIVSHRAGETTDDFIADLAVGISADYLKCSIAKGERVAKYNRLLTIEQELL
ncbi:MAG: phosphopyruvate hydratase [Candidatus Doudnabacteria bacterium]|nr:phosphopyruvate hydratase [Candidatus Doudnabacteria bacterium]